MSNHYQLIISLLNFTQSAAMTTDFIDNDCYGEDNCMSSSIFEVYSEEAAGNTSETHDNEKD